MEIINNKKLSRFEADLGEDRPAVLEYRWLKGSMVLMHTFVPDAARHRGTGAIIVRFVLDYVRENNLKVIVYCPFVAKFMKLHPEYQDLIDPAHPLA